jgi:hypothetical protein
VTRFTNVQATSKLRRTLPAHYSTSTHQPPPAMPKGMRPMVKVEYGAEGGHHAEEGRQEEADAGGER